MIHIAFCVWSAISPTIGELKGGGAHTGFLPAIDFVKGSGAGAHLAGAPRSVAVPELLLALGPRCTRRPRWAPCVPRCQQIRTFRYLERALMMPYWAPRTCTKNSKRGPLVSLRAFAFSAD
jgi:hypothetical protein